MGSHRLFVVLATVAVLGYSASVLWVVATTGEIGIRCVFGSTQKAPIDPGRYDYRRFEPEPAGRGSQAPGIGAELTRLAAADGSWSVAIGEGDYTAVIRAQRQIGRTPSGGRVLVEWRAADGSPGTRAALATVRPRPFADYVWSLVWFAQEMIIFAIGAIVSWRRPLDRSARVFFWLCVVTVGAFVGGYHWSEIVIARPLIFTFAFLAMLVPVLSLHFFLVFPRPNPLMLLYRLRVLAGLYGAPALCLAAIWGAMLYLSTTGAAADALDAGTLDAGDYSRRLLAQKLIKWAALGYIGYSVAIFGLCIGCLVYSYRRARNRLERNQVRWILLASLLSSVLIAYLMLLTLEDTATLGLDSAAWPMYVVSLLYTTAYAVSITRYKLMQAEEIFRRSVRYLMVSVGLGVVYSVALVVGALAAGYTLQDDQTSREATVVAATALVILGLSGAVRRRFEQAIDRRFFREKYKFDQAMRQMSHAVDRLVDRGTLGRRLLEAAAEVLGLDWGAIYLREGPDGPFAVVAGLGPEPEAAALPEDHPIVRRLREQPAVRLPGGIVRSQSDPVADALIALGGEVAAALTTEHELAGVLVLGPKRSGLPYDDEELVFLGALASVAALALHSASIHRTLDELNRELRNKVEKIAEQQRRILVLQDQLFDRDHGPHGDGESAPADGRPAPAEPEALSRIRGSSPIVRRMLATIRKAAASPSAVLVLGESGTGKELVAEAIHAASPRADGPLVKVHCAALAPGLLESELFGHVRSAFTGADRDRVGRFQQADGGTLFLDEIGDIGLDVQTKLLRVLQTKSFERVGSSTPITVDVRIVAATHRDLPALIRAGRFREDLYYRLNVISIRTPSLRERREDIFELALTFLRRYAERSGKAIAQLDDEAIEALTAHDWPGNVRELENVIERAVVLAEGPAITPSDLPPEVLGAPRRRSRVAATATRGGRGRARRLLPAEAIDPPSPPPLDPEAEAFERHQLLDALAEARSNKSEAARLLGLPRSTFVSKLKKYDLMDADPSPSDDRGRSNGSDR